MAVHTVVRGETLSRIAARHQLTLNALLAANPLHKADPDRLPVGTVLQLPGGRPARGPRRAGRGAAADPFRVPRGQITFDAEGLETPGPWFSRSPHVPSASSGVTIGRGYDLKERSQDGARADLLQAGVDPASAEALADCCGLHGAAGRRHIAARGLADLQISPEQQQALFLQTYDELAGDVLRICRKADVLARYGRCDWDALDPRLRDLAVDLRYRGDYTPASRQHVQPRLVAGDLDGLRALMADRSLWVGRFGVPADRFRRRQQALA